MKKNYWLIFCVLFLFLSNAHGTSTMHLILVGDTDDTKIGLGCKKNINRIKNYLKPIAKSINMTFCSYELINHQVDGDSIISVLKKLEIKQDKDVIIFHFSGHGTNHGTGTIWPRFLIPNSFKASITKIHTTLKTKKPRFLLTLSDCCNGNVLRTKSKNNQIRNLIISEKARDNFKELFLNTSGDIIATASKKGQVSYYEATLGGYFTLSFCEMLIHEANSSNFKMPISWKSILVKVQKSTNELAKGWGKNQLPQYKLNLITTYNDIPVFGEEQILEETIYVIKSGDTLNKIAKKYNVNVNDLREWNQIEGSLIIKGKKLLIFKTLSN
jgi:hypothetical protein